MSEAIWFNISKESKGTVNVLIADYIGKGGVTADMFARQFNAITAPNIKVNITSNGGSIDQGMSIFNTIKSHPANVETVCNGIAASIAAVILQAGKTRSIYKNSQVMIHRALADPGPSFSDEMRAMADQSDRYTDEIAGIFSATTGKPADQVKSVLAGTGTWYNADQAKAFGLVDSIISYDGKYLNHLADRVSTLQRALELNNAPDEFRNMVTEVVKTISRKEKRMPLKPFTHDGKQFVNIEGTEHEVEIPAPSTVAAQTPPGKSEAEFTAELVKTKNDAIVAERSRRAEFDAVLSASGLKGAAAEKLKGFYDQNIAMDQLKFLAGNAIGERTKAVGENSGNPEGTQTSETPEAKAELEAGKRFDNDADLRKAFPGGNHPDRQSNEYKSARGRYVAAARQRFINEQAQK